MKYKLEIVSVLIGFLIVGCIVLVGFLTYSRSQSVGYETFKNLEFGTDLEIVVSPNGIYTRKFVSPENYIVLDNYDDFVLVAEMFDMVVYWEGYNGTWFWTEFGYERGWEYPQKIGFFYVAR